MLNTLKQRLNELKGGKQALVSIIKDNEDKVSQIENDLENIDKAREVVRIVALQTQQQLEYSISEIVSLALASIFDDPYKLKLDFVEARGKTECNISFEKNGQLFNPLNASGGGCVDVACMGLRLSLWTLQQPKSRAVIILDEPFKCLSKDLSEKAGQVLKLLSDKLGLQFIMVTHDQNIIPYADKLIKVTKTGKYSKVEEN